jgi:hypothetical protein
MLLKFKINWALLSPCASKIRVPAIDPAPYSINSWVNVSDSILPKAGHGMNLVAVLFIWAIRFFKSASACVVTALALWIMPFRIEGKPVMALTLYQHHLWHLKYLHLILLLHQNRGEVCNWAKSNLWNSSLTSLLLINLFEVLKL